MANADETMVALDAAQRGDKVAVDKLMALVYEDLKETARRYFQRERSDHTLQPTAIVNEAYFRMVDQTRVNWQGSTHFKAIAALMMKRVLADHGRKKRFIRVTLSDELTGKTQEETFEVGALDAALTELHSLSDRQALVVEYRFFAGLSVKEAATVLEVSERTVKNDFRVALAWLRGRLART